ncbi:hypothetical protein BDQ17DRAFT_1430858 [Cyathus striatus]|nr:hypothetical protein BDQ17DRAFT_1430858 [Cyathus striatus]
MSRSQSGTKFLIQVRWGDRKNFSVYLAFQPSSPDPSQSDSINCPNDLPSPLSLLELVGAPAPSPTPAPCTEPPASATPSPDSGPHHSRHMHKAVIPNELYQNTIDQQELKVSPILSTPAPDTLLPAPNAEASASHASFTPLWDALVSPADTDEI